MTKKKAYDTTSKDGIKQDLNKTSVKVELKIFINSILTERVFNARVGTILSDLHDKEMCVPQGSILSVTFFNIKIKDIVKRLNLGFDCSVYIDDFLICCRSKNIQTGDRQLQQCLIKVINRLQKMDSDILKQKPRGYISINS